MNGHPGDMGRAAAARVKLGVVAAYRTVLSAFDRDPFVLLAWVAVIATLLTAVVRGVHTWALDAGRPMVSWAGVVPGFMLAATLIAILGWVYWEKRLNAKKHEPYVVALAASVAVIGVCTEASSGLTAVLWQEGHIASTRGAAPSLWAVEQYYLWHLADAVPLVEVPQTVRWPEPQGFDDHGSGVLLLLFKVMVIIPLVSIAMSGYVVAQDVALAFYTQRWPKKAKPPATTSADDRTSYRRARSASTRRRSALREMESDTTYLARLWLVLVSLPVLTLIWYLALRLVIAPSSPAHAWLTAQWPEGLDVGDHTLDLPSMLNGVDGVTAAVVIFIFLAILGGYAAVLDTVMARGTGASRATALIGTVMALGPAIMVGAAVALALLHMEVAETTPSIPQESEVNAAISWFGWHLAEVIPVLDVPGTLNWDLRFEFVDRWTGVLLVMGKLFLVGLLAGPIAMVVRMSVERARARRPTPTLLGAAGRFRELLDELTALVDTAERETVRARKGRDDFHLYRGRGMTGRGSSNASRARGKASRARYEASQLRRLLGPAIEQLQSLFGPGEVTEAAQAAASSLTDRLDSLQEIDTALFFSTDDEDLERVLDELRDDRRSSREKVARYDEAVSAAFSEAG
jgi:hypothetical protein